MSSKALDGKFLLGLGIALVSLGGFADTTWVGPGNGVLDGDWAVEANWDNGLPGSSGRAFIDRKDAAFAVTMSDVVNEAVRGLVVSGMTSTAYAAKLSMTNSTLPVSGADLTVVNGEVVVGADAQLSVTSAGVVVKKGGRLTVDGGAVEVKDNSKKITLSEAAIGTDVSELLVRSGNLDVYCPIELSSGGSRLTMTGGKLTFHPKAANTSVLYFPSCTVGTDVKVSLSGDAEIDMASGGNVSFGVGTTELAGNAKLMIRGSDAAGLFIQPYNSDWNKSVTVNLSGNSQLSATDMRYVQMGVSRGEQTGTKCSLNISGGTHEFGAYNVLGVGNGTYTTTLSGGRLTFRGYGVKFGTIALNPDNKGTLKNGKSTLNVSGGVLYNEASACMNTTPKKAMWGFIFGCGSVRSDVEHFEGYCNISGTAVVTNGVAPWVMGAGRATGRALQTGGTVYCQCAPVDQGWNWDRSSLVLGAFGGEGYYTISNGTLTTESPVWIGGISKSKLQRTFESEVMPTDKVGQTFGRLEVAGGTFTVNKDMVVGADGTGVVCVVDSGTLALNRDLILSNSVDHAAQVFIKPTGAEAPAFAVKRNFVIRSGATLTVDVRDFDPTERWTKLIDSKTRVGSFAEENITLLDDEDGEIVQDKPGDTSGSIWYHRKTGLMLILR